MIPRGTSHSPALGLQVGHYASLAHPMPTTMPSSQLGAEACTPTCGAQACMVDGTMLEKQAGGADPRQHTKYPYVTGTSVIGLKYRDGVMIVADTLGAYGSTKRYKSMDRIVKVNKHTLLGAGGEISDFQYIQRLLRELTDDDYRTDDGIQMQPPEIYSYLSRVMYNRRSKFDPLWNSLVVGGVNMEGEPFLGLVGMTGTHYTDSHVTTGFANALARPLLRSHQRDDMSEEEALGLLHEALRVCYYRDKQSINKFTLAKATKDGVTVSEPFSLETRWDYKLFAQPTQWSVGAW